MKREEVINQIKNDNNFDAIIIGGGSVGAGVALDLSARGYKTLLLEQYDWACGTSSRSTKLLHGGVRYLAQMHFPLVMDSLKERDLLLQNAPHLAKYCAFIIPCYSLFDLAFYRAGLFLYDLLGKFPKNHCSYMVSKNKLINMYPNVKAEGLVGGIVYYDGTFDDARLNMELVNTAQAYGGLALNYAKVVNFHKQDGKISGLDVELTQGYGSNEKITINSKCVLNTTGIFSDNIRKLDDKDCEDIVQPSQGVHIMFNKNLFNTKESLLVPKTSDGRVLFSVPWHDFVIVGTTDTKVEKAEIEPQAKQEEVDFIVANLNQYLNKPVSKNDISAIYAGIRPLIKQKGTSTSSISREEHMEISPSNLVSLIGGKWTAYRRICEKLADFVLDNKLLQTKSPCITESIKINNYLSQNELAEIPDEFKFYGKAYYTIKNYPEFKDLIHPKYPYNYAQVKYAVENEYALTLADVLSRRIRLLFLDSNIALEVAPNVVKYMADLLNKDSIWVDNQIKEFEAISKNYLAKNYI